MAFQNPKTATIKLPRHRLTLLDREHLLDVALACACAGSHIPATDVERKEFERYIMTSPVTMIKQSIKDVLANLSEEERRLLFR